MVKYSETTIKKVTKILDKEHDRDDPDMEEYVPNVILKCPSCHKITIKQMSFDDSYFKDKKKDDLELHIHSCVSGGIYRVYFKCPNCGEEIDLI
ncbi:MAG: hypothetical protein WC933_03705 [Candidatus Paceibacterota bacterium]|jgi:hypothetical protein